ncbi:MULTISPECIES: NAD(P)-dependent oxidoreductase [Halomonadaceae]|uniref:NAD-binding protein n=1 Tax=Vreelandella halophila TaxID=86177 RepID=A0A9X4YD12_9GAMM|nr:MULTISPECIES: NAD(P)-dependent oxidoreductase [Halomonas]MYL27441.1 NAD-binding protein [Halomonas utahensis]MYL74567.1 NAD-binding protein [Halomonas sp. 22501_18_FS]
MQIAFIGLGVMGFPMAGHLARHDGFSVRVYNRTEEKAQDWARCYPGETAEGIWQAVVDADAVVTCVGADPDLRALYTGEYGIIANAPEGALLIDHTTASASVTRELAEQAAKAGHSWVDAPVSGGQKGAENAQLTIMCGGERGAFDRALPVLNCYGKAVHYMGEAGHGQLTKMVNQITVAGLLQGLSEGLHFAEEAGLDPASVVQAISGGAAQSWQMDNRAQTMIEGEYNHGFAVDWMRKDLGICIAEARNNGASLPVAALVDQFYSDVQNLGGGRWDTSALLERLRANS